MNPFRSLILTLLVQYLDLACIASFIEDLLVAVHIGIILYTGRHNGGVLRKTTMGMIDEL